MQNLTQQPSFRDKLRAAECSGPGSDKMSAARKQVLRETLAAGVSTETLLQCPDLVSQDLCYLIANEAISFTFEVKALLDHPAADVRVVCALLQYTTLATGHICTFFAGMPPNLARKWEHRFEAILALCDTHSRKDVATLTAVRRKGVTSWNPNWEAQRKYLKATAYADRAWAADMAWVAEHNLWGALDARLRSGEKVDAAFVSALKASVV